MKIQNFEVMCGKFNVAGICTSGNNVQCKLIN